MRNRIGRVKGKNVYNVQKEIIIRILYIFFFYTNRRFRKYLDSQFIIC